MSADARHRSPPLISGAWRPQRSRHRRRDRDFSGRRRPRRRPMRTADYGSQDLPARQILSTLRSAIYRSRHRRRLRRSHGNRQWARRKRRCSTSSTGYNHQQWRTDRRHGHASARSRTTTTDQAHLMVQNLPRDGSYTVTPSALGYCVPRLEDVQQSQRRQGSNFVGTFTTFKISGP